MKKLKVMTVVGTRPEIIRLSRVLNALDANCDHVLVHTGQNYDYELNQVFFEDLSVKKPDYFLNSARDSSGAANTIGNLIIAVDRILEEVQPEALLVLGDTNSCLSVIPAKRRKIPIFHMEAGNRCFDQRVPEEINRKIVDHTADINLTYSSIAREYLLREGLPADQIIKTGSPMYEVLQHYLPKVNASKILTKLNLEAKKYFVVSLHREENIENDRSFFKLVKILNTVASDYNLPVIVSTHPRTRNRIYATGAEFHPLIQLIKPLGFNDYVCLQMHSKVVLSDSGTITEEASILQFSALNLRESHERPEGMEEASVMMVGLDVDRVRQGIAILQNEKASNDNDVRMVADYSMPNVSDKVVKILQSYTNFVRQRVWREYN